MHVYSHIDFEIHSLETFHDGFGVHTRPVHCIPPPSPTSPQAKHSHASSPSSFTSKNHCYTGKPPFPLPHSNRTTHLAALQSWIRFAPKADNFPQGNTQGPHVACETKTAAHQRFGGNPLQGTPRDLVQQAERWIKGEL